MIDSIESNWDQSLDVEKLAATFDVSVRSLFRHFRKFRDWTPQDFIKSVRQKNISMMLETGDENVSVMSAALKCDLHSPGHFARDYRETLGERPSDTMRRKRLVSRH